MLGRRHVSEELNVGDRLSDLDEVVVGCASGLLGRDDDGDVSVEWLGQVSGEAGQRPDGGVALHVRIVEGLVGECLAELDSDSREAGADGADRDVRGFCDLCVGGITEA